MSGILAISVSLASLRNGRREEATEGEVFFTFRLFLLARIAICRAQMKRGNRI